MLSDRERETLGDMERALHVEDPRLVRRCEKLVRRCEKTENLTALRHDWVMALALGLCLLFSAVCVLVGAVGEAFGFATLGASVAMVRHWLRLSHRLSGRRPDEGLSRG